jgi:gamma-glutamylcyclotransferase (GGCT)/AIG2-like uncharacterized protein YtfP
MVTATETEDPRIIAGASDLPETVFIYGTLKRGFLNHRRMDRALYRGDATANGLRLYDLGPFPMAVPEAGFRVDGEVYALTGRHLQALDRFEGAPRLYQRVPWTLNDGRVAWIYVGRSRQIRHREAIGTSYLGARCQ